MCSVVVEVAADSGTASASSNVKAIITGFMVFMDRISLPEYPRGPRGEREHDQCDDGGNPQRGAVDPLHAIDSLRFAEGAGRALRRRLSVRQVERDAEEQRGRGTE